MVGGCNGPSKVDISVADIQVTQVTQTASHSVPLVVRKATAVRVTVGASGGSLSVSGVNGHLHVFVNRVAITDPGSVNCASFIDISALTSNPIFDIAAKRRKTHKSKFSLTAI